MTTGRGSRRAAGVLLAVVLAGCGGGDGVAGSGNKSPNAPACGISGTVTVAGTPAADVHAVLYRICRSGTGTVAWAAYDTVWTDSAGTYAFEDVDAGEYAVDFTKDGAAAFSGYFTYSDESGSVLDTAHLDNTLGIVGMFRYGEFDEITVGLIGTDDESHVTTDTVQLIEERFFVMNGIAAADFHMYFLLRKKDIPDEHVVVGFDALTSLDADTTYTDEYDGITSSVLLQDGLIRVDNALFTMVCLVELELSSAVSAKGSAPDDLFARLKEAYDEH